MLEHLTIRNLATIEAVDLELDAGFTVLSGETGAGKSILIDALGLVLGSRGDPALVRAGTDKAEISAAFRVAPTSAAAHWLREQALIDDGDEQQCLIRRVLHAEGRSRAFINGHAAPVAQLRELGERLVDVFGQNESHSLRLPEVQRDLLDAFGDHAALLDAVAAPAARWHALERQIEQLRAAAQRDPAELDLLRHQVRELEALNLQPGELDAIAEEHKRLANGGRLLDDGARLQDQLYGADGAVHDQLAACLNLLRGLVPLHAGFADAEALVASAQAQVREAADGLRRLLDRLDLDPERLAALDARLASVHELARKHRVRADELPERLEQLRAARDLAEDAGGRVDALLTEQAAVFTTYQRACEALGAARRACAPRYSDAVTRHVRELGMPHARFEVRLESASATRPRAWGDDDLTFDFSANPGQPPRALAKVASGGELSRVSLALQVVAQQAGGAPTMIFDEVDAGIGGAVADAVGKQLRALGAQRQVLCVTHLGQVAACGMQHIGVSKQVRGDQTFTALTPLAGKARVAELVRMIGGRAPGGATEAMARELLKSAQTVD